MESMKQYVIRKLTVQHTNLSAIAKETRICRTTLYRIIKGDETSFTKIDTLNNFFKKLAD